MELKYNKFNFCSYILGLFILYAVVYLLHSWQTAKKPFQNEFTHVSLNIPMKLIHNLKSYHIYSKSMPYHCFTVALNMYVSAFLPHLQQHPNIAKICLISSWVVLYTLCCCVSKKNGCKTYCKLSIMALTAYLSEGCAGMKAYLDVNTKHLLVFNCLIEITNSDKLMNELDF